MRTDEDGNECPGTLGEYRDVVASIAGENNKAVWFLDQKIQEQGRDAVVVTSDSKMRKALLPMMLSLRPPKGVV